MLVIAENATAARFSVAIVAKTGDRQQPMVLRQCRADVGPGSRGPLRFIERARRREPRSMSEHTLVAILYNHDRLETLAGSNRSACCHARIIVSYTASSASNGDANMR
ncbi:hypothetical protein A5788_16170 [Gordonia sp. 852002-50816_SCH5313054-c]|nr:hypothetical protein A5788_16170 [Gordonia sp. 852002-50816_SCH5313054-c]OBC15240.1 hypothetical protein A5786_21110 [Gordonia sp. 852002-50816_SCH5313054-a]